MNKTLRFLHIEDSPADASLIARHLRRAGYEPVAKRVENAEELREALETSDWDVVLCDYAMPQFDALRALAMVKEVDQDVPFIIISGTVGEAAAVEAMRAGAQDYLMKGNLTRLGAAIERELQEATNRRARRRTEQALRESEERYRDLVENAHDIIYSHDLQGNYTSMNRAGAVITGYTIEEVLKLNFAQIVAPEFVPKAREMMARKLAGEDVTSYEVEIIARDGRRIGIETNTQLVYQGGSPVGVQGVARDVTERKSLEQQLRQSQRLEAIGQLAGGVAHDFNNLLTAILGYSDLSLAKIHPDDPIAKNVHEIKRAGERAAGLTRQLLAFSRKQILAPLVLDLNSVISDINKMLRRLIGEDIELVTKFAGDLGLVKADPTQMEQVLMNLVVNARDAMPRGGRLTIETRNVTLDEDYEVYHEPIVSGDYVMLAVSDNGAGMSPETRARIFEPFFTTKEVGKGTGLGLSTIYGIVKQSGGYVWVYSEEGNGTTFKIYLPRVADALATDAGCDEATVLEHGNETLLLVEDDPSVRKITSEFLMAAGYVVLRAGTGDEALRIAATHRSEIQLVLTDVVMPGLSGRELGERLKEVLPQPRIVFMSGYTDDAVVRAGIVGKDIDFIEKPFTPKELATKIREALSRQVVS